MGGSGDAAEENTMNKKLWNVDSELQLDEETASSERRLKAMAQKKLGKQSLLRPLSKLKLQMGQLLLRVMS